MAVELRLALETRLNIKLPLVSLTDSTTIAGVAARILRSLSSDHSGDDAVDAAMRHELDAPGADGGAVEPEGDRRPLDAALAP